MTEERLRGVLLYVAAAGVLLAGALWFVRAAPPVLDAGLAARQERVENLIPDIPMQTMADTVVLNGGATSDHGGAVQGGSYELAMACAGSGQVQVVLGDTGNDSGLGVRCSERPITQRLENVALAGEFSLRVTAGDGVRGAVFRWRLDPVPGA